MLHTLSTHSPVQTRSAHILRPRNSPPTHSNSGRCTQEMLRSTTNKHNCRRVSASNKCTVHITAARVNVRKGNIHNGHSQHPQLFLQPGELCSSSETDFLYLSELQDNCLHYKESSFQTLFKVCAAQSGKKDGKVEEKDGDEKWI